MYKIGKQYHIVPKDMDLSSYMLRHHTKIFSSALMGTSMYVKINQGYTATVRRVEDLSLYLNDYGKDQVDPNLLQVSNVGSDVPAWFYCCVDDVIKNFKESLTINA